jgi:hypothetical protein
MGKKRYAHFSVAVVAASIHPEELLLLIISASIAELNYIRLSSSTLVTAAYFQLCFPFLHLPFSGGGAVVVGPAALCFFRRYKARRKEQRRYCADQAERSGYASEREEYDYGGGGGHR